MARCYRCSILGNERMLPSSVMALCYHIVANKLLWHGQSLVGNRLRVHHAAGGSFWIMMRFDWRISFRTQLVGTKFSGFEEWEMALRREPLINLGMFRRRNLALATLINVLIGYCLFIGLVSIPILVNVHQESVTTLQQAALEVGILLSGLTVPIAIAAIPGGGLSDRIGIRNTVLLGLGISLVGFALIWQM